MNNAGQLAIAKKIITIGSVLFLFVFYTFASAGDNTMEISSTAFQDNEMIPIQFTCQGKNVNPPLVISGIPSRAKTLVLINEDPDAPVGIWDHWILFNIPVPPEGEITIPEHTAPGVQGRNSWGRNHYGGPCPPSGTHRYFFKAYALDTVLDLRGGAPKKQVEHAMKSHIVSEAQLIGLYKKSQIGK